MVATETRRAVGVFSNYRKVEAALEELRDAGFPMHRVSVISRDDNGGDFAGASTEQVGNKADEGAAAGAITGGALGGLTGLLVGLGAVAIPGLGPIAVAGAGATALATTLTGGAIGAAAGGLIGALVGLGIPEERARAYNDRVAAGDYLIMVEGSDQEIQTAESILHSRGIEDWGVYQGTATSSSSPRMSEPTVDRPEMIDRRDEVTRRNDTSQRGNVTNYDDIATVIDNRDQPRRSD